MATSAPAPAGTTATAAPAAPAAAPATFYSWEQIQIILIGIWALVYSIVILMATTLRPFFRPVFQAVNTETIELIRQGNARTITSIFQTGNARAVETAVWVLFWLWVAGKIHKAAQRKLRRILESGPDVHKAGWLRKYDLATTLAPPVSFAVGVFVVYFFVLPTPVTPWVWPYLILIACQITEAVREDIQILRFRRQKKI